MKPLVYVWRALPYQRLFCWPFAHQTPCVTFALRLAGAAATPRTEKPLLRHVWLKDNNAWQRQQHARVQAQGGQSRRPLCPCTRLGVAAKCHC